MSSIREAERLFSEFLEKKKQKLTSQRRLILRQALDHGGHYTADGLLDFCRKKDPTVSKATVYRSLALLKECHVLEEQDFGDGKKLYERAQGRKHHDHFVCVRCGKIIEFENEKIEELQSEEARKQRFQVVYHSLKLFGTCSRCS